jgi:hypothetical protein
MVTLKPSGHNYPSNEKEKKDQARCWLNACRLVECNYWLMGNIGTFIVNPSDVYENQCSQVEAIKKPRPRTRLFFLTKQQTKS